MSFVGSNSDLYSASGNAVVYIISCYFLPYLSCQPNHGILYQWCIVKRKSVVRCTSIVPGGAKGFIDVCKFFLSFVLELYWCLWVTLRFICKMHHALPRAFFYSAPWTDGENITTACLATGFEHRLVTIWYYLSNSKGISNVNGSKYWTNVHGVLQYVSAGRKH